MRVSVLVYHNACMVECVPFLHVLFIQINCFGAFVCLPLPHITLRQCRQLLNDMSIPTLLVPRGAGHRSYTRMPIIIVYYWILP